MSKKRPPTQVVIAGQDKRRNQGIVNAPVFHASTVLYPDVRTMREASANPDAQLYYGRRATPTTQALTEALVELEGGVGCMLYPSGLAAITQALLAFLNTGDHLLMVDSAYDPARRFCNVMLKRLGVETTYYDPRIGGKIADLIQDNTKVVFTESPGSLTFEMQDIPAIAKAARAAGAIVMMDNTWASPLFFKPLEHGVDVSIQALTKYVIGHSDAMMGAATANARAFQKLAKSRHMMGECVGPDDVYLATRGLRTLDVRLRRHEQGAIKIARWLENRPEVHEVLYPALESHPDHAIWKRDFSGASGLMGVVLKDGTDDALTAMIDHLKLFGIGYSWGGYESLAIPVNPAHSRTVVPWEAPGPMMRLHIGLEDPDDLIADLEEGFGVFGRTMGV